MEQFVLTETDFVNENAYNVEEIQRVVQENFNMLPHISWDINVGCLGNLGFCCNIKTYFKCCWKYIFISEILLVYDKSSRETVCFEQFWWIDILWSLINNDFITPPCTLSESDGGPYN